MTLDPALEQDIPAGVDARADEAVALATVPEAARAIVLFALCRFGQSRA